MLRRKFLQSVGALGIVDVATGLPREASRGESTARLNSRDQWVTLATKISEPLLTALAADRLKDSMPVEERSANPASSRAKFTYLEGFGRLISGLAPWLELESNGSTEGPFRARQFDLARRGLANAVDPKAKDFMNFSDGSQPLVDASFLALGLLRGPRLWEVCDEQVKKNILEAFRRTRRITPPFNNWLLFSAMIETFFLHIGEEYDKMRIDYALRQHEQWYKGDGIFGDGPEFHWDYYNSYVIQPYLRTILGIVSQVDRSYVQFKEKYDRIAARYAVLLERMIAPDGSYPAIGRSISYRCGAFHHLSNEVLLKLLPKELAPGQVRSGLSAVISRTLGENANFDSQLWLRIGLSGHQPQLAETYISTGSLYLCATAFLPLGLPPDDEFWTSPPLPWTAQRIWHGQDVQVDSALKL
jgi:hypothetical protein